ncbi:MAG: transcriptional regulator [Desulfovibrio sp.]|nr:MAG: transcriptional regulator [Desulfovibrio sp.]
MANHIPQKASGLILGKFMPPHLGHCHLVDFARSYATDITVLMDSPPEPPIAEEMRVKWLKELFPDVTVATVPGHPPQDPSEHPDFWDIWRGNILAAMPDGPELVFASEDYGPKVASLFDARFVPVDLVRELVPISATKIRNAPNRYFDYLPGCVRPHFARRVCIVGPESTGKSTLAQRLAEHYGTVHVTEYARPLLELKNNQCDPEDIPLIARGQAASEEAMARQANRVLICDTDMLTTTLWSNVLFGDCPQWIQEQARSRHYHLYLVARPDCPYIDDPQRYLPHQREVFLQKLLTLLEQDNRPYVFIGGDWEERFQQAVSAIDELLTSPWA